MEEEQEPEIEPVRAVRNADLWRILLKQHRALSGCVALDITDVIFKAYFFELR